ncbi:MAG: helix-turn-helix transcriptional regulator [Gemmatimonadota bacterium]|nr:helix-turn-helix transcriptional regulator [Gemmatimonadota bacterium]
MADTSVKPPFKITPVVFHVLLAMSEGDAHGYGIMQEVEKRTEGSLKIGPGSLYFTLNRLLEVAMIKEGAGAATDDARRKYYRLTEYGRAVLESELRLLSDIVDLAREKAVLRDEGVA